MPNSTLHTARIVRLKVTLKDVSPPVWRRVEVSTGMKLTGLHTVLQAAMGWSGYHMWEISGGVRMRWWPRAPGAPDPEFLSADEVTLFTVLAMVKAPRLLYVYDFGDFWQHDLEVEETFAPDPSVTYPRLLAAEGKCPPEDCDGPEGYADLLNILGDRHHPDHTAKMAEYAAWQDPNTVDVPALEHAVNALHGKVSC